ncbi:MAG: carbohydrate kinase family protein [Candidatus Moraniibacteriota bacterium]|nr:MAG: carbohydrate kinase family protein [Candidatus Moranbacteria bacterium]
MVKEIVCIGSLSQDVFFPYKDLSIVHTPKEMLSKQKMVFEVGAKYRAENRFEAPGGCATNVSQGLALLGIHSILISNVGKDTLGDLLLQEIRKTGVDTSFIQRLPDRKTDLGAIIIDEQTGERTIFYNRDANECLEIPDSVFHQGQSIFVGGLYGEWKAPIEKILTLSKEKDLSLYYNPSQNNIHEDAETVWAICRESKGIFLNKDEAMELLALVSKKDNLNVSLDVSRIESEEYLSLIIALAGNAHFVVITDGSRGAWVYDRNVDSVFRCRKNMTDSVVDSTGAGDAFTSGFLGAIFLDRSTGEALSWGIANATNVIRHYGGKEGLLSRSKIEEVAHVLKCAE